MSNDMHYALNLGVRVALANGMNWDDLTRMVKEEKKYGNPVVGLIDKLHLETNSMSLLLNNNLDEWTMMKLLNPWKRWLIVFTTQDKEKMICRKSFLLPYQRVDTVLMQRGDEVVSVTHRLTKHRFTSIAMSTISVPTLTSVYIGDIMHYDFTKKACKYTELMTV
ncbi:hypothetical protein HanRHA438_Chr12g0573291 [Helianthus annuus]|uniref:Uncharacterized protein n=1 Tax=Helianthus annuus TaxID=4232 RepID=A0A9K3HJX0_HELAN|nr:uncharacterized protein LOC110895970 isoform X2 [Helianthus annuus]XP_035836350.1 uncharacterized protein LOC110895970 isoform X2 [Helianthus annuus]KAF5779657.1 hypothetical protein HanXRQr2_Chr12g0562141 [Helianthus annuus]KAJ0868319.1 hypothetical protein HanRHA438_Chr12g0573291 [Helianthus annuus]